MSEQFTKTISFINNQPLIDAFDSLFEEAATSKTLVKRMKLLSKNPARVVFHSELGWTATLRYISDSCPEIGDEVIIVTLLGITEEAFKFYANGL